MNIQSHMKDYLKIWDKALLEAISFRHKELQFRFYGKVRYISNISKLQDFVLLIITFNNNNLFNFF